MNEQIEFIRAAHFTKGRQGSRVLLAVIHTMEAPHMDGVAKHVAKWFAGRNAPRASAHFCIDRDEAFQCVTLSDTAWAAPGANGEGVHFELAGYAKQTAEEWANEYNTKMLDNAASLVAMVCYVYGIPIVKLSVDELHNPLATGICGHADITSARCNGKGHTDPGPNFPWERFVERVRYFSDQAGTPNG